MYQERLAYLAVTILFDIAFACQHYHDPACLDVNPIDGDHFMNQFIVEIKGGEGVAKRVAEEIGCVYKKPMKTHADHYFIYHLDVPDRHKMKHPEILNIIRNHVAVKTADQQFVWQPTIRELEEYEDMVGLEEPIEVKISYFDPDEIKYEEKTAHELIRPDDVFIEPEPIRDYPPLHTIVDFDKLYAEKNKEKEERARKRRQEEELKKQREAEKEELNPAPSPETDQEATDSTSSTINKKREENDEKTETENKENSEGNVVKEIEDDDEASVVNDEV